MQKRKEQLSKTLTMNNTTHTITRSLTPTPRQFFQSLTQIGMSCEFLAIVISLMILLSILIVITNATVVYIYFTRRHLRIIPKNFFILSLAIADILVGTISVNFYAVFLSYNKWPFGEIACDMWLAMDYSSCNASTSTKF